MPAKRITAQEAYDMAKSVQSSLSEHTSVCTERWTASRLMLQEVRDEVRKLTRASDERSGMTRGGVYVLGAVWAAIGAAVTWFINLHK